MQDYALHRATKIFNGRNETGKDNTILSDSTAAMARARSGGTGSGQRLATATNEQPPMRCSVARVAEGTP